VPDWNRVHAELRRRGVTLLLPWEEYRAEHPDGYGYSRFCDLSTDWRRGVSATMRQTHVAGEKLFVDYAGDTVPVFDGATGEERRAHVFVAVLGASTTPTPRPAGARGAPTGRRRWDRVPPPWPRPSCPPSRIPSRASGRAWGSILQLAKAYGEVRLEAACQRGLTIGSRTSGSIASILRTGLDRAFHDETAPDAAPLLHANSRGRGYYH
jgi:transposase